MATPDEIRNVCHRYVTTFGTDTDGWAALFAEDAVQEDPVGAPGNQGRPAIRKFLEDNLTNFGSVGLELVGEPIVVGHEAVMVLQAITGTGAERARLPQIVDMMTFDDQGAIIKLRAFWDLSTMVADPE